MVLFPKVGAWKIFSTVLIIIPICVPVGPDPDMAGKLYCIRVYPLPGWQQYFLNIVDNACGVLINQHFCRVAAYCKS